VGIASPDDMDELELRLLGELYDEVLVQNLPDRPLTVVDLKNWHHLWLGNVYAWAGQERSVNLGKDGFQFATASLLTGLLRDFERKYLAPWTPCIQLSDEELVYAIAVTHVELIVIHPFREGNGRLSRLLADVMAVQAGHQPLDYSSWEQRKPAYIGAIHAGFLGDYGPMAGQLDVGETRRGSLLQALFQLGHAAARFYGGGAGHRALHGPAAGRVDRGLCGFQHVVRRQSRCNDFTGFCVHPAPLLKPGKYPFDITTKQGEELA
jgi:cell filamentation protein